MSDKGVVAREQDGSAYGEEECKQQEQNFLDQQDGSVCASERGTTGRASFVATRFRTASLQTKTLMS